MLLSSYCMEPNDYPVPGWQMLPLTAVCIIGFNHGLSWGVKYMARGPSVTTKPDGEAGGFGRDRRHEGHVYHTSRQSMIKPIKAHPLCKTMIKRYKIHTNNVNNDGKRRQQSTTGKDWAWLFPGSNSTTNFIFQIATSLIKYRLTF